MLAQDYLALNLTRLRGATEWNNAGRGLNLIFPRAGVGEYVFGATRRRLASGDVLLLNAELGGKIRVASSSELIFWCFSANFEHLFPLFDTREIPFLRGVVEGLKNPKLYPGSSPLAAECHRLLADAPSQFNLDHRGQLLRVISAILAVEFRTVQGQKVGYVRIEEHMTQVFEKLSVVELLNLSVGELAERFSCSRRHLNRLFHQHFGFSVAALRMEMRLLKAVSLLRDPDAKIIRVAEESGFNHLGMFNTYFKKRFGASPGQWRKQSPQSGSPEATSGDGDMTCPLRTSGLCPWSGRVDNGAEAGAKKSARTSN